ncbi:hypothetical protein ACWD3J_39865 [Streptomyces sp. NPDC002755]
MLQTAHRALPAHRPNLAQVQVRAAHDAIVGAITGPISTPSSLLLGRRDTVGQLQYIGRTTTLPQTTARTMAGPLTPAAAHPWEGWTFSAGWGSRETLNVTLMGPGLVVEVSADVARDGAGRFQHPVRLHLVRDDLTPSDN